ncbi:MAG: hypothetical protein WDN72_04700 [Alphaproteobacteria bacterium]
MQFHESREAPLHQLLLSWLPLRQRRPSTHVQANSVISIGVTAQMQIILAQQVATSLRLQGVLPEDDTMLASLEALASAGEISLGDFVGRLQNLFPRAMEKLDVSLRMKIAALTLD